MNVTELLRQLQADQDEATAHADDLQRQIADLTADLVQAHARVAEPQTARTVVKGIARPGTEPQAAATPGSYQRLLSLVDDHPNQPYRVRDLHGFLETAHGQRRRGHHPNPPRPTRPPRRTHPPSQVEWMPFEGESTASDADRMRR